MLSIKTPDTYKQEREYILNVMLERFLGLEYAIEYQEREDWCITEDGKELILPDTLFQAQQDQWLTSAILPKQPLEVWDTSQTSIDCHLVAPELPIIYGDQNNRSHITNAISHTHTSYPEPKTSKLRLPIDIFGSAFFMLTRYEEVVKPDRDEHDRFPATASLAYQENFLDRPIVNEYLEILWACMERLWPYIERKKHDFRILPTHDVDHCLEYTFKPLPRLLREVGYDVKIKQFKRSLSRMLKWSQVRISEGSDPDYDTFNWLMDISEKTGLKSAFYFMAAEPGPYDEGYKLEDPRLKALLRCIHERGHEIGLHPSYKSYRKPEVLKGEIERIKKVLESENISQNRIGGRQHYLRWRATETWLHWVEAGLSYDSSVGYTEMPGFRCGVCYEYPVFDLKNNRALALKECPLIVMECSLLDNYYMGLQVSEALEFINRLKERCRLFQGNLVILWHNNMLDGELASLYERVLYEG